MQIIPAELKDIDTIFSLYDAAIAFQKTKFDKHWQSFDRELIETEIKENRLYMIMEENQVACIFSVAYNDPFIWGEKDKDPSMYLHRIVTNPLFRGRAYVKNIIDWSKQHGKEKGLQFIRMDTWGDNEKLISYYASCGFRFLGIITPQETSGLPKHYNCISLSLFEIPVV